MDWKTILVFASFALISKNVNCFESNLVTIGTVSLDDIYRDLCYHWKTKRWPIWVRPEYRKFLMKCRKTLFYGNGEPLSNEIIADKCKMCPKPTLGPEIISDHWEMCHFAATGNWNGVPPSEQKQLDFFYISDVRKDWKVIWYKCSPRFQGYPYLEDSVHYPEENLPRIIKKKPIKKSADNSPRNLKSKPNKRIVEKTNCTEENLPCTIKKKPIKKSGDNFSRNLKSKPNKRNEENTHCSEEYLPRTIKKKPIKKSADNSPRNLKSKPNKRIVENIQCPEENLPPTIKKKPIKKSADN